MSGTQYNIITMASKQLIVARRGNNLALQRNRRNAAAVGTALVLAPLGVAALRGLVDSEGAKEVGRMIGDGSVALGKEAWKWWRGQSGVAKVGSSIVTTPAPAAMGVSLAGSAKYQGNTKITHRELCASFDLSTTANAFRISPLDGGTFPYLSALARMYDKYKVNNLRFVIVSSSGTAATGRYYMCWDPSVVDKAPSSSVDAMAMKYSVTAPVWQTSSLTIPQMKDSKFCSYFPDVQQDYGLLSVLAVGTTATVDLYVEYDISLIDPESSSVASSVLNTTWWTTGRVVGVQGAGFISSAPTPTAKTVMLPPGQFLLSLTQNGTSFGGVSPVVLSLTGDTVLYREKNTVSANQCTDNVIIKSKGAFTVNFNNSTEAVIYSSLVATPLSVKQFDDMYVNFA
jgi:hypothetical protein